MVKQTPVGAHYGLKDWLGQRISAVFLVAYTLFMIGFVLWCAPANHEQWKQMLTGNFIRPLTLLFVVAVLYHAWIGIRDIWMDYVKHTGLRLALQSATGILLLFYAVWAVAILWG